MSLKATVVIQHDMRDIGKLPAFPAAAKYHHSRLVRDRAERRVTFAPVARLQ